MINRTYTALKQLSIRKICYSLFAHIIPFFITIEGGKNTVMIVSIVFYYNNK